METKFVEKELPEYRVPTKVPMIAADIYSARFEKLEAIRKKQGYDCFLIYADREHCANMSWLTGFDPRFEEALWVQGLSRTPALIVGNECYAFARDQLKLDARVLLYQQFSLQDQPRSTSNDLVTLLAKTGLAHGMRVGMIGWKSMRECDAPFWIVAAVQEVTGSVPENVTGLVTDPPDGLRLQLEPEMILFCEYAACISSDAVKAWVLNMHEGVSERDSARHLHSYGLELSVHPMVNFGARIPSGLKSPRNAVARRGEYAQCAFGVIGALTCRAGRLADRRTPDADGYLALVENYLKVVRSWYAALEVGAIAGDVVQAAVSAKNAAWEFALNPGHLLHLDEWVASPFAVDSKVPLRSGYAIQQDIIPVPTDSPAVANIEDGLILADHDLQQRLQRLDPLFIVRCMARRDFMRFLGYRVSEEVLPLSNIAGIFFPFLLEPKVVVSFR